MHTMKVQTKYYNLLKAGIKTVELRLWDEKRQLIKVGDEIIFSDLSNPFPPPRPNHSNSGLPRLRASVWRRFKTRNWLSYEVLIITGPKVIPRAGLTSGSNLSGCGKN